MSDDMTLPEIAQLKGHKSSTEVTPSLAVSRQEGGSRKLHLERDLKSELTKVMNSIGSTGQGIPSSSGGIEGNIKFNVGVEFKRLHNIDL